MREGRASAKHEAFPRASEASERVFCVGFYMRGAFVRGYVGGDCLRVGSERGALGFLTARA
jgi:hypothetical protein